MAGAALLPTAALLPAAALAVLDEGLSAGFAHAAPALPTRALWCAWTWAALARAHLANGDIPSAEPLIDRLDALPLPPEGATGAVARWAAREVPRLRDELTTAFAALRDEGRAPLGFVPHGCGGIDRTPDLGGAA